MTVKITFQPDDITTTAKPGEMWLEVADRAGVEIPTGCLMGSCHACEIELDEQESICACISAVPGDREQITVYLLTDPSW